MSGYSINLYWPIYKNLEKELLKLADVIHFDDTHVQVYSAHIGNMLVRTAVEIEAISKELYMLNGGTIKMNKNGEEIPLFFDSDCIAFLDKMWSITRKTVRVAAPTFYFKNENYRILCPLDECDKKKHGDWKNAYQAFKHSRTGSLSEGNILNLIKAMAALYLLNLYYRGDPTEEMVISKTSDVFAVDVFRATRLTMVEHMDDHCIAPLWDKDINTELERFVYIERYSDKTFHEMYEAHLKDVEITRENYERTKGLPDYYRDHPEKHGDPLMKVVYDFGVDQERIRRGLATSEEKWSEEDKKQLQKAGIALSEKIVSFSHTRKAISNQTILVLNKNQRIYPEV